MKRNSDLQDDGSLKLYLNFDIPREVPALVQEQEQIWEKCESYFNVDVVERETKLTFVSGNESEIVEKIFWADKKENVTIPFVEKLKVPEDKKVNAQPLVQAYIDHWPQLPLNTPVNQIIKGHLPFFNSFILNYMQSEFQNFDSDACAADSIALSYNAQENNLSTTVSTLLPTILGITAIAKSTAVLKQPGDVFSVKFHQPFQLQGDQNLINKLQQLLNDPHGNRNYALQRELLHACLDANLTLTPENKEKIKQDFKLFVLGRILSKEKIEGCEAPDDCTHMNLSGMDLSGLDLSGKDFSNSDLSGCNLSGCNLSGTDLYHTDFRNVTFDHDNPPKFDGEVLFYREAEEIVRDSWMIKKNKGFFSMGKNENTERNVAVNTEAPKQFLLHCQTEKTEEIYRTAKDSKENPKITAQKHCDYLLAKLNEKINGYQLRGAGSIAQRTTNDQRDAHAKYLEARELQNYISQMKTAINDPEKSLSSFLVDINEKKINVKNPAKPEQTIALSIPSKPTEGAVAKEVHSELKTLAKEWSQAEWDQKHQDEKNAKTALQQELNKPKYRPYGSARTQIAIAKLNITLAQLEKRKIEYERRIEANELHSGIFSIGINAKDKLKATKDLINACTALRNRLSGVNKDYSAYQIMFSSEASKKAAQETAFFRKHLGDSYQSLLEAARDVNVTITVTHTNTRSPVISTVAAQPATDAAASPSGTPDSARQQPFPSVLRTPQSEQPADVAWKKFVDEKLTDDELKILKINKEEAKSQGYEAVSAKLQEANKPSAEAGAGDAAVASHNPLLRTLSEKITKYQTQQSPSPSNR